MRSHDEDPDRRTRLRLDLLIALMVVQIVLSIGLWVDRYRGHETSSEEQITSSNEGREDVDLYSLGQSPTESRPSRESVEGAAGGANQEPPAALPQIKIQILNGCGKTGIAKKAENYLVRRDYVVKDVGNAERQDFRFSEVQNRSNNAAAARDLARQLGIDESRIKRKAAPPGLDIDLTLIIGADFRTLPFGK